MRETAAQRAAVAHGAVGNAARHEGHQAARDVGHAAIFDRRVRNARTEHNGRGLTRDTASTRRCP